MPYLSEEVIKLSQEHIKFLQDFNAELMKENVELRSKLMPQEAYKNEN